MYPHQCKQRRYTCIHFIVYFEAGMCHFFVYVHKYIYNVKWDSHWYNWYALWCKHNTAEHLVCAFWPPKSLLLWVWLHMLDRHVYFSLLQCSYLRSSLLPHKCLSISCAVLLLLTSSWYVCIRVLTHAHTNTRSQLTTFLGSLIASSSIFSSGTTTHTVSLLRLPLIKTVSPVEFKRNVNTIYVYQWSSVSWLYSELSRAMIRCILAYMKACVRDTSTI